jgi:hypothetical protein
VFSLLVVTALAAAPGDEGEPAQPSPEAAPVEAPAPAAAPAPPPDVQPEPAPLPRHFAMYVSLIEPSATLVQNTFAVVPESAVVRLGVILKGKHALLLGLGLSAEPVGPSTGVRLMVMPTYRFFMMPLREAGLSMYVEAHAFFAPTDTGSNTMNLLYGGGVGFGGEYLFVRNFGIVAGATLRVTHGELAVTTTSTVSETLIEFVGTVALALHF